MSKLIDEMCQAKGAGNAPGFMYRNRFFHKYTTPEILDEVGKFQFLPTDIVVATHPRSGTTVVQQIIWQIKNRKTIVKEEKVYHVMNSFPFLEVNNELVPDCPQSSIELLQSQRNDQYRLIKTHVSYALIKENMEIANPKLIIVMRNAKDCLISNFHFHKNIEVYPFKGSFDEFFKLFLDGMVNCGGYFDSNLEWWALRQQDNVLIVFYEDLVTDLRATVENISRFLGDDVTSVEIDEIVHNCSFSTMYNDPNINLKFNENFTFLRKGIIGDWKTSLSEEQNRVLNEKIKTEFERVDLKFIYE